MTTLPKPNVLETLDYEALLSERKSRLLSLAQSHYQSTGETQKYEQLQQTLTLKSEPLVKLLEENVYRELLLRQRINDAASAVMLPLAVGADLDNLGALYGISRGQISEDTPEGDEPYRQRLMLAPKSLSTAGSKAAYKFHALSAGNLTDNVEVNAVNANELHIIHRYSGQKNLVKDATVESINPCEVQIYLLGFDQYGLLDSSSINEIAAHLSDDAIRPIGDRLSVNNAELIYYRWQIKLHLVPELENTAQVETILALVKAQLADFVTRHHFIGKAIRQSTLLGTIGPLIDGWVELSLFNGALALPDGEDLVVTSSQAPHYDLTTTNVNDTWLQRIEQAVSASIEVVFDG